MMAWLYKNKKRNTVKVHRLVANAFIPNPDNKPQIDHINTVKDDNRVCNLRWCTEKENSNNPITAKRNGDAHRGAKSSSSVSVMQLNTNGDLVKIWECMSDIERELGFNHSHISQCCGGKKNVAYGFTWKYTDNG